jgi:DNA polymerase-3 subunit beta
LPPWIRESGNIVGKGGRPYTTAIDLEMQITARSELLGKGAQSATGTARKLQDLLRPLPEDTTLNLDTSGRRMPVRAGRSRFKLRTLPVADSARISQGYDQVYALSLPQRDLRCRQNLRSQPCLPQYNRAF